MGDPDVDREGGWTPEDIAEIITNPLYAIGSVHPDCVKHREPIFSEEQFIQMGVRVIKEDGPERFIRLLLQNLKNPTTYGYRDALPGEISGLAGTPDTEVIADPVMGSGSTDPERDEVLEKVIRGLPQMVQVQYSTNRQLVYLRQVAVRLGLYDAAEVLTRVIV